VGAHDVVGSGDGGGDIGDGSWSSEIGSAPSSMPGTAAPATLPAPGGVDDANGANDELLPQPHTSEHITSIIHRRNI